MQLDPFTLSLIREHQRKIRASRLTLIAIFVGPILICATILFVALVLPSPRETYKRAIDDIRCDAPRTKAEARWCATMEKP